MASKAGFSLLELSIVLALSIFLATIVVSGGRFLQRILVRTEIEKLYIICRYLQQTAMATNTICTLTFNREGGSYTYGPSNDYGSSNNSMVSSADGSSSAGLEEKLPAHLSFGVMDGALGPPSAPTKVIESPITFTENTIEFHPTGAIKSGTVYLVDQSGNYMCALSCPISHVSFIRLYEYNGGWKLVN